MKPSTIAGTVRTVAALARTPAGRQVINVLTALALDPDTRWQARQSVARWRARRARGQVVDEATPSKEPCPAQTEESRPAC